MTIQFEVKNRWSGKVKFVAEINCDDTARMRVKMGLAIRWAFSSGADLRGADLRGADLRGADLSGADLLHADLSGADLTDADLSGADLTDADLSGADLSGADLSGADLSCADLRNAVLSDAELSDADLRGAVEIPAIPALDTKILAAIDAGGKLEMDDWHKCETTHCRAGWAITLAGEAGQKLEAKFGASVAGAMIYARSYPDMKIPNFYTDNESAMADIRRRAASDPKDAA